MNQQNVSSHPGLARSNTILQRTYFRDKEVELEPCITFFDLFKKVAPICLEW